VTLDPILSVELEKIVRGAVQLTLGHARNAVTFFSRLADQGRNSDMIDMIVGRFL
jgi:hypothetical protein